MNVIKQRVFIPFLIALSLLTRLPVAYLFKTRYFSGEWSYQQQGLSPLYYPMVGLLLAGLLYGFFIVLPLPLNALVAAALLVFAWVLLTGALHLDGLADSVDAAFFSHHYVIDQAHSDEVKKKEMLARILGVFKDPAAGPMAVVALVLVLLLKTVLVYALIEHAVEQLCLVLALSLLLSRSLALMLMVSTPYVSTNGLGSALVAYLPKTPALIVMVFLALITLIVLPFLTAVYLFSALGLLFFLWRQFWLRRIGGFVGDCVGALIELAELSTLLVLSLALL